MPLLRRGLLTRIFLVEQTTIVLNRSRIGRLRVVHLLCYHPSLTMPAVEQNMISKTLRELFLTANNVLVLTGAGVSAESGVPTFRGGGQSEVWKGVPFEVISSAQMLERDLAAVWE